MGWFSLVPILKIILIPGDATDGEIFRRISSLGVRTYS